MKINNIEFTVDSVGGAENDMLVVFPHSEFTHFFSTVELDKPVDIEGYENYTEIKCVVVNPLQSFSLQVGSNINDEESITIITTKESVSIKEAKRLRTDIEELAKKIEIDSEAEHFTWAFPLWNRSGVYNVGDRAQFENLLYRCIEGHVAHDHDTPDKESGLWVRTKEEKDISTMSDVEALENKYLFPEFEIDTDYKRGDRVLNDGRLYKAYRDMHATMTPYYGGTWYPLDELEPWDETREYENGEAVMHDGWCYMSLWGYGNGDDYLEPNTYPITDGKYWEKV